MMLLDNYNSIMKREPFVKPEKPQQIALSNSKCSQARGMCSTMHSCSKCIDSSSCSCVHCECLV